VVGAVSGGVVPLGAMGQLVRELPAGDMDPGRFLIACREMLVERYRGRRLFIAVDDAPMLDAESAGFLAQLVVMGCGFVAFTARSEDPLPPALVSLCKDRLLRELKVGPLSDGAVGELIRLALGGEIGAVVVAPLTELAAGNPLFLRELLAEGIESGCLHQVGGRWELRASPGISRDLRRLVATRLGRLTPEQREALEVLAVAAPVELALVARLCDPPALEALERRGMLRVSTDGRRQMVGFRHPLFAEVVLADVPATRRATIGGCLLDAVADTGARRRDDPLRLARWHLDTGRPLGPDTLIAAAWRAALAGDDRLAERIADAAMTAGAGDEAALIRAGAIGLLGRFDEAERILAALQAGAEGETLRARAAARRALLAGWSQGDYVRALDILESVESALTDPKARMIVSTERLMFRTLLRPEPRRALDEALRLCDDNQAPEEARLQATVLAQLLAAWLGRFPLVYELDARGHKLMEAAGHVLRDVEGRLLVGVGMALTYDGRLPEAVEQLSLGFRRGVQPPLDGIVGVSGIHLGLALAISGHLHDAVEVSQEAVTLTPRTDFGSHTSSIAALAAVIAGQAGNRTALSRALATIDEHGYFPPPAGVWLPMARAWEAWSACDAASAAHLAVQACDRALEDENLLTAAWACHHALEFGHPQQAVARLWEIAEQTTAVAFDTWARHAATLADDDAERLDAIADEYRDRHEYLYAVQAYAQTARLHRAHGRDHAAARSIAKATQVAAITGQLAVWLPPEQLTYLTLREIEIATLAATGAASSEIAARLYISVRTVNNHLAAIYTKLGIHHRSELAPLLAPSQSLTDGAG
jgi:DNA-binding CsgD family transcriptional regulator